jgi:TfoX/Sxy family transcriptional regulator of competence genes
VKIDKKGCKRIRYKRYQTLLETLSLLDKPQQCLRDGISMNKLKRVAAAARRMQEAKNKLFEKLRLHA